MYLVNTIVLIRLQKLKALSINKVTGSIVKEYRDGDSYHIIFWHKSIYILDRSALRIMLVTTPEIMFIDPDKPELLQSQRYDMQTCRVINYTRKGDKFIIGDKKYRICREIESDVMGHNIWGLYICDGIYIIAPKWILAQLYAYVSRTKPAKRDTL